MTHVLTIIVPANSEEHCLADCLTALLASEQTGAHSQLQMVANVCTDRTVEAAQAFESSAHRMDRPCRSSTWPSPANSMR